MVAEPDTIQHVEEIAQETILISAFLALPISFCSVYKTIYSAHKNKNWIEMLPLIFAQVLSAYIWICQICMQVGFFRLQSSNQLQIQGSIMRNSTLRYFLSYTMFFDTVVLFLYTWSFLNTLIAEEQNRFLCKMLQLYKKLSILAVPLIFIGLYVALCIARAKRYYYFYYKDVIQMKNWSQIGFQLQSYIGYLTTATNIFSCLILILTLRLAKMMTANISQSQKEMQVKKQLNAFITISHLVIIVAITIVDFLLDSIYRNDSSSRWSLFALGTYLAAIQDIYLAYNMFFILSEIEQIDFVKDERNQFSYPVITVTRETSISSSRLSEGSSSSQSSESSDEAERRNSIISRLLVQQFVQEVEVIDEQF